TTRRPRRAADRGGQARCMGARSPWSVAGCSGEVWPRKCTVPLDTCGSGVCTNTVEGPVCTVNVWAAGVGSVLPAGSVARTAKVWSPPASESVVTVEEHAVHAEPSRLHSNVEPASVALNANVGVVSIVGLTGPL